MSYDLRDQIREVTMLIDESQTPIHGADIRAGTVGFHSTSDGVSRPMSSAMIVVAAFAVVMILVGGVAWLAPFGDGAPSTDTGPRVTDTIRIGHSVGDYLGPPVATDGAVWVGGGTVSRIDSSTRQVTDTIEVGDYSTALFATADAVWVVGESVSRIDLDTREVTDTIQTGIGTSRAASIADGALWVSSEEKGLVEIDLATRRIINEYQVPVQPRKTANNYAIIEPTFQARWSAVIDRAIWFLGSGLIRFDLEQREFTDVLGVPPDFDMQTDECCIAADDAIWLVSHVGHVWRFDLDTFEITDKLELPVSDEPGFNGITTGISAEGAIWIPNGRDESVYRIDQATRQVTHVIPVGVNPLRSPVLADGAIWVPAIGDWPQDTGTVTRIDINTLQVTHTFDVGGFPLHPMSYDGAIWVPTLGNEELTRIQTK